MPPSGPPPASARPTRARGERPRPAAAGRRAARGDARAGMLFLSTSRDGACDPTHRSATVPQARSQAIRPLAEAVATYPFRTERLATRALRDFVDRRLVLATGLAAAGERNLGSAEA